MIQFKCHACGTPIQVQDEFAGKQGECPKCRMILDIPRASASSASPAPAGPGAAPAQYSGALPGGVAPAAGDVSIQPPPPAFGGPQGPGMTPVPPMIFPPRTSDKGQAVAALVLGIVSFIPFIGVVTAILAVVFGILALSRKAGRGLAIAGLVMAVVGILAQVGGGILGITLAREQARRTMCGANLNGISKALAVYQADSADCYPFIVDDARGMSYNVAMKTSDDVYSLKKSNTECNMLENLNLLVKGGYNSFKQFRCPSVSSEMMDRSDAGKSFGFSDGNDCYIDYAYQIGYANVGGATNAAPLNGNLDPSVAIMADKPGNNFAQDFGKGNNGKGFAHKDGGVNVLYAGYVQWPRPRSTADPAKWSDSTFYAGHGKNNIYTRDMTADVPPNAGSVISPSPAVVDVPQCQYDSVLFWGFK